jgi:epsilon-lactone hydrolase
VASLSMRAVEVLLRIPGKRFMLSEAAFCARYDGRDYPKPAPMPRRLRDRYNVERRDLEGHPVFLVAPRGPKPRAHILYTHGGGYVDALLGAHWSIIARLAQHAIVTVPLYPLAPEHSYRAAYNLLERLYSNTIESVPAGQVALCGDSAGGGLALGQALHYRDRGLPLPGRLILFSPWLDLTMCNSDALALEDKDVMLARPGMIQAGLWWAGGEDRRSPLLSPIFGDLSGLPPIDVFQGTHDVLLADARKLKEAVVTAGGSISLHEYAGAFHVFVGATFTREARDAFGKIDQSLSVL